ncbi:hypothetical protein LSAT2_020053 [Lamellibrachia satsuma]|nr:hypothetical protein LSAT2_020053 [Lamellibrachia satsuma]
MDWRNTIDYDLSRQSTEEYSKENSLDYDSRPLPEDSRQSSIIESQQSIEEYKQASLTVSSPVRVRWMNAFSKVCVGIPVGMAIGNPPAGGDSCVGMAIGNPPASGDSCVGMAIGDPPGRWGFLCGDGYWESPAGGDSCVEMAIGNPPAGGDSCVGMAIGNPPAGGDSCVEMAIGNPPAVPASCNAVI